MRWIVACAFVGALCGCKKDHGNESPAAAVSASRQERVQEVAVLATTQDAGPPVVAAAGGSPAYMNRIALRTMLKQKKYAELSALIDGLETDFEADASREGQVMDAGDAFSSAEPELLPDLDAWATATPDSFAPYLARGTYLAEVAFAKRGMKWAKDTPKADMEAMTAPLERSQADLDKALTLRPKAVAALREKMIGGRTTPALIASATAACPKCVRIRITHMYGLTPRWGGSYEQMDAFAKASIAAVPTPEAKVLAGFADLDRGSLLRIDKKGDAALAAIDRARAAGGEYWEFWLERARTNVFRKDYPSARLDIDKAATLRPMHPDVLAMRAYVAMGEKSYELAGRDVLDVIRMEPTSSYARDLLPSVVQGISYDANQDEKAGRVAEATRKLALGLELAPGDRSMDARYRALVVPDAGATTVDLPALKAAVLANPDDFDAYRRLDDALAAQNDFAHVVEMWGTFIAKHPDDARAFLERGGAYSHLGKVKEAYDDASKACDLGSSGGCTMKKQAAKLLAK